MLGQVATLRDAVDRHRSTAPRSQRRRRRRCWRKPARVADAAVQAEARARRPPTSRSSAWPACFRRPAPPAEYWDNILDKVDAITEIPAHRWDWRLYFDSDRSAKDKIYSKWGGFLDDLLFDPTRYGMPPKSIESVDPMQLMALEVAQRTLADAGYAERQFDRERASVIIGASGGAGDVGVQYGVRAELPRFTGALPDGVAGTAAGMDRGQFRRNPAERRRRTHRQPPRFRRRRTSPPTPPAPRRSRPSIRAFPS